MSEVLSLEMLASSLPPVREPAGKASTGRVFWITGLSGAGKTTVGMELWRRLRTAGRSAVFLDGDALELRQQALDLLDKLPTLDTGALHAVGEAIAGTDPQPLAAFLDTINAWLSMRLDREQGEIGRLARLADASERINAAARDAEIYNLERKPLVFGVFGLLAEATRG